MTTGARFLRAPRLETTAPRPRTSEDRQDGCNVSGSFVWQQLGSNKASTALQWRSLDRTAGCTYPSEAAAALAGRRARTAGRAERAPAVIVREGGWMAQHMLLHVEDIRHVSKLILHINTPHAETEIWLVSTHTICWLT